MQETCDDSRVEQARQAYLSSGSESRAAQAAFNDVGTQKFNMNQPANSYLNNLRGAQMQEAYQTRTQPINEITALMTRRAGHGAAIPGLPGLAGRAPRTSASTSRTITRTSPRPASAMNAGIFNLAGGAAKLG